MNTKKIFAPKIISKEEFFLKKTQILRDLKKSIFVYPTDTIYGLGCNALDEDLIEKLRYIKNRHILPFSIIPPNYEWVKKHCVVDERVATWLKRLPGPYTLILKLKDRNSIPYNLNLGLDTIGIRFPNSWFTSVVKMLGFPITTTSANLTGGNYMSSLEDMHPNIKNFVDYIIYDGRLKGKPSELVYLNRTKVMIKKRVNIL